MAASKKARTDSDALQSTQEELTIMREKVHSSTRAKRESALLMRLSAKEQEVSDLQELVQDLARRLTPDAAFTARCVVDPTVGLELHIMAGKIAALESRAVAAERAAAAPESEGGRALAARCKRLEGENAELRERLAYGERY